MTKAELYIFVTGLLDSFPMDTTQFDAFLDVAQSFWENQRPWMSLRTIDATQTISPGNTFTTEKSLPADFRKWYTRNPITLSDSFGNGQVFPREVAISNKFVHNGDSNKFYCNYSTKKFYICGSVSQPLTANLFYIRRAPKMSIDEASTWELDVNDEYTKILGFTIAVYYKLGVDYDIINNAQGDANASVMKTIFLSMTEWDSDLQESAIQGEDYQGGRGQWTGNSGGGNLNRGY